MKPTAKNWFIYVLVSLMTSIIVYFTMAYLAPHVRTIQVQSDAVAVANTYIVLTTLLVTLFAALVALVSFYWGQNNNEMRHRQLEDAFKKHLQENDNFGKELHLIAKERISKTMDEFKKSPEYEGLVHEVLKRALNFATEQTNLSKSTADVLAKAAKDQE